MAKTEAAVPAWQSISLRLPADKSAAFTVTEGHRGRPDLRTVLTWDTAGTALVSTERFDDLSPARKARLWGRWLHTGEAGGIAGQIIAGVASLAAVMLVWTGFALTWRRLRKIPPPGRGQSPA